MNSKMKIWFTWTTLAICANSGGFTYAMGDKEGNGGDADAQLARTWTVEAFTNLEQAYGDQLVIQNRAIPLNRILGILQTTTIAMVKGPLNLDGRPVEAKNYPGRNLIEIDKAAFKSAADPIRFLFHEVLGLADIPDENYAFSGPIAQEHHALFSNYKRFPMGTDYQMAHRAWAKSRFVSIDEARRFIDDANYSILCSWIAWGRWENSAEHYDPNHWYPQGPSTQPVFESRQTPVGEVLRAC